jgi:hypothetical protein
VAGAAGEDGGDAAQPAVAGDDDVEGPAGKRLAQPVLAEHVAVNMPEPGHLGHLMPAGVQQRQVEPACCEAGRDGRASGARAPDEQG